VPAVIVNYEQVLPALGPDGSLPLPELVINELEVDEVELSALQEFLRTAVVSLREAQTRSDVLSSPECGAGALLQSFLAERCMDENKLELLRVGLFSVRFDRDDWLGWAAAFVRWSRERRRRGRHRWLPPSDVEPIPAAARVAVFGDWGTALYGAPRIARALEQQAEEAGFELLLHLGDVYYSGTERELKAGLLEAWPNLVTRRRSLNANHEMYTGGHAYFETLLPEFNQSSSVFAFQNDHWLLAGLDSAFDDDDLAEGQEVWLWHLAEQAGDRRLLLFTHHQPFSLFEKGGERLRQKLAPILTEKRIFAWYFGHEHRCVLYDKHEGYGLLARCVGHGGYPYLRDSFGGVPSEPTGDPEQVLRRLPARNDAPSGLVLDGPNHDVEGHQDDYGPHGFLVLDLQGPHCTERLYSAGGTLLRTQQIA
jgi:hypothetical protein